MNVSPTEILQVLQGVKYPAKKDDLIQYAKDKGAEEELLDDLKTLPEKTYNTSIDISKKLTM